MKPDAQPAQLRPSARETQAKLEGQPFLDLDMARKPQSLVIEAIPASSTLVEAHERFIARRTRERGVLYRGGARLSDHEGENASVQFPVRELLMADAMTHNHPWDKSVTGCWYNPLTWHDLNVAAKYDLDWVRAVTPHGLVYEARRPTDGWPDMEAQRNDPDAMALDVELTSTLLDEMDAPDSYRRVVVNHALLLRLAKTYGVGYSIWRYHA